MKNYILAGFDLKCTISMNVCNMASHKSLKLHKTGIVSIGDYVRRNYRVF